MLECPKCKNDNTFFLYRWHLKKHELTKVVEDDETVHYETVKEQHIKFGDAKQMRCGRSECDYEGKPEEFGFTA